MNGDANGTLGYSPGHHMDHQQYGTHGTFGYRAYELTVGGDSQSSKGRFNNIKKIGVQAAPKTIFDQIEDNLNPYKLRKRN
jgi:hypothetical protein